MRRKKVFLGLVLGIPFLYIVGVGLYLHEEVGYGLHSYLQCDQKIDVDRWRICLRQDIHEDSLGGYYTDIQLGQKWRASLYRHFGGGAGQGTRFTFDDTRAKNVRLSHQDGNAIVSIDGTYYRFKVPEDFVQ